MMFSDRIDPRWLLAPASATARAWLKRARQTAFVAFGTGATDASVATAAWLRDSGWEPTPEASEVSYWITRFAALACGG